jgi:hypothetical protein
MVMVAEEPAQLDEPVVAVWAPGSAVLALGEGDTGEQAVAVCQVSRKVIQRGRGQCRAWRH